MTESIQILMEKDRLQPLADNIKVLKGSDSITLQQMEDTIEETNTDIVSQADLITQLANALQGKSVPGDGASGGTATYQTCKVSLIVPEHAKDGQSATDTLIYTRLLDNGEPWLETEYWPFHPALYDTGLTTGVREIEVVVGTQLVIGRETLIQEPRSYKLSGDCFIRIADRWISADEWSSMGLGTSTTTLEANKLGKPILINGDCTIEAG